jgi:YegS/Rv2252/BmrU family lipid kinase
MSSSIYGSLIEELSRVTPETATTPQTAEQKSMPRRPALVVLNCLAGTDNKESIPDHLQRLFEERNFPVTILSIEPETDLRKAIADEVEAGCRLIVAGGGDGTINAVAEHVRNCSATFGVLPLGTLNHFAKDLGIPTDLEKAVDVIINGVPKAVDAGEVNGQIFLNNSSMGLYPQLVRDREAQQTRGRGKWLAFTKSLLTVLVRYKYYRVHISVDGKEIVRATPLVFVGNNRYKLKGTDLGSRERLDEGVLSINIPHSVGRIGLVWLSLKAILGNVREDASFDEYLSTEFYIDTRTFRRPNWMRKMQHKKRLQNIAVDGEVFMLEKPLKYKLLPKVLNVLVPAKAAEQTKLSS